MGGVSRGIVETEVMEYRYRVLSTRYVYGMRAIYLVTNILGVKIPNTGIPISMYKQILALSTNSRILSLTYDKRSHRS